MKHKCPKCGHRFDDNAQAKAAKAPVKIMIPTVIFIFPVVFIILLGPAVVSLLETFG